ncbi:Autotransporter assembly factor TamB [Thiorhodovibrio winogradskyi]|uniref:Autotransporter assembly factor TamB n=1 Tax=Thiorhodovibrio winogradskyi TaxID=77007 RepID=A0ABZ0S2U5_9GAMM|nr:translocation/assembly module TamB domain-containing protein [Thiorhodovibrio winogradskyi]
MTATDANKDQSAGNLPPRRRWPLWRWLLGALTTLLLLLVLLLAWVLTTQGGLRLLVDLGESALPDALEVGAVEGRLIDAFQVRDLHLRLPELDVRVALIDLRWRPARLLGATFSLARLHVQKVDILTAPSDKPDPPEPFQLPEIKLPLALEADAVLLEHLRLGAMDAPPKPGRPATEAPDQPLLALTRAELAGAMSGSKVELRTLSLSLSQPDVQAEARGQLELRGDYPADLQLDWTFAQAPAMELTGQGRVSGDARALSIAHGISGSAELRLDAEVRELLAQPAWTATIELEALDLPRLVAGAPRVEVRANLRSDGTLERASLAGTLSAEAPDHGEMGYLGAELDLTWQNQVLRIQALNLTEQGSGGLLDLKGQIDFKGAQGQVAVTGVWEALRWPLTGEARLQSPRGTLDVSGQLDAFDYRFSAEAFGQGIPETRLALSGAGDQQGTRIDELRLDSLGGQAIGKGRVNWSPELNWEFALTARDINPGLQWPGLDGALKLKAETSGSLARGYGYQLKADLGLTAYPAMMVNLTGEGTTAEARIDTLSLETLGGQVTGTASLNWVPELAWDADLALSDIDPGQFAQDWPGRLSGQITTSGHLTPQGAEGSARIREFGGQLRGYPVGIAALLELASGAVEIREFKAYSGATQVTASGQAAETLAVDLSLRSPNLSELLPAAKGRLGIDAQVRGETKAPRVTVAIDGRDLALQGQGIASIKGNADVGLGPDDPIQAELNASKLLLGGMPFASLRLTAEGTLPSHRLSAALAGETLSLQLAFAGQQQDPGGYRGQLSTLKLTTADFGTWALRQQAPMVFQQSQIQVGPLCIGDGQGSGGCARFSQRQAGDFDASLKLDRFNFSSLEALMPPNLELKGHAVLDANFKSRNAVITGQASLKVPEGGVDLALPNANEQLVFSTAGAELVATVDAVNAQLKLPLQGLGALEADARLPGLVLAAPDIERQVLTGAVRLDLRDFSRLEKLAPDVRNLTGAVAADIKLGGTLGKPMFQGQAELKQLAFQVPLIGLAVTDTNLTARTQGSERLEMSGGATIGGGQLALTGSGLRAEQGWTMDLKLNGDKLKVADTKEYFALLKTDLTAGFGPDGGSVKGLVEVEEARITPRSIPAGTVSTSPDVVVVGQGDAGEKTAAPFAVDVQLRVRDSVRIEAFGLRARLRGNLRAFQDPGQPLLGDGQLEILDGTYRLSSQFGLLASVGAPLKIEQGILVFAKTPLGNPGLVLRAQREGGDMTAGVRVLGTLKKPKLTFFSDADSSMTDSEIVNYLLTGVPPRGNASDLDRSLSVGTYIAPKLFVEYESNLGDQGDKVKLRYDLNNWIQLQTETGDTQGADVFFKFEN